MKIIYTNNNNDNRLYSIFLDIFKIDYKPYEISEIDRLLIRDTIKFIDRITTNECKKMLGRIGEKKYSDLKEKEVKSLLKIHLQKQNNETILEFYKENQVILDMFQYEVCEVLNISKWELNKIKHNLKISGTQVVNVYKSPKICSKYDRRYIYEILLYNTLDYTIKKNYNSKIIYND